MTPKAERVKREKSRNQRHQTAQTNTELAKKLAVFVVTAIDQSEAPGRPQTVEVNSQKRRSLRMHPARPPPRWVT